MNLKYGVLLIVLAVLAVICALLFASVVGIKLIQTNRENKRKLAAKKINPPLRKLFSAETVDFFKNYEQHASKLLGRLTDKYSLQTLENILLEILEASDGEIKVRARMLAYYFKFPEKSLLMIRDRLTGNIAIGCRKAGFYQYEEAIPDILKTLDIVSSNTQHQALMALARIGNTDALLQAFDKIHRLILVNERAVSEIINIFTGDRYKLYKEMIHHPSVYLVRLFLKAIDREIANKLIEEIIAVYRTGDKETRLACIIAIGRSGNSGKTYMLIHALDDPEWEIRAVAAKTLGVMIDPDAVEPLAKAARDGEWWVRQNAVTAILAYPNREAILISIAQTGDRYSYDSMLYTLGKANKPELLTGVRKVWPEIPKSTIPINSSI